MRLNKRGDTEISSRKQMINKEYFENLYSNKLEYVHEVDKLLVAYDLAK